MVDGGSDGARGRAWSASSSRRLKLDATAADIRIVAADLIRLRYPAHCASCGAELAKGDQARWDRAQKTATCARCLDPTADETLDRGEAGGSAAREWQRRHERREANIRARYAKLGSVVLTLSDDPRSTNVWAQGARGERALGSFLDPLREEGMAVLHDRRIPGSRANIDHLVVAPAGVFVIDAKNYKGRVERRDCGGWFSTDYRLYVGGRDKTTLIAGMAKQANAVRAALAPDLAQVLLTQAICFVAADWSLLAQPLRFGEVHVLWPRALAKLLRAKGPGGREEIAEIERRLALALPAA